MLSVVAKRTQSIPGPSEIDNAFIDGREIVEELRYGNNGALLQRYLQPNGIVGDPSPKTTPALQIVAILSFRGSTDGTLCTEQG
jgi:hypothetical protein